MKHWKNFQSLMQIIVSMAPAKIKNTDDLMLSNPDSLLVYSRLYPINSKTEVINSIVEHDWRTPADAAKDTVFRFEKKKNNAVGFLQWNRFLVANIPYTFKGSFKKANRSRVDSFTGIGDEKALKILQKVGQTFGVPTVTDIHQVSDAVMAAEYGDVLQIPAFLVRQTDLVVAAAETGKVVNLKKGQLMVGMLIKQLIRNYRRQDIYEL